MSETLNQNERLKEALRRLQLFTDQEIAKLQDKIKALESQKIVSDDISSRIISLENENVQLQDKIADLKEVFFLSFLFFFSRKLYLSH